MKYLLDANVCIQYMNRRSEPLIRKLEQHPPDDIAVCAIVEAELYYGAMKSNNPEGTLAKQQVFLQPYQSLPFDTSATRDYGRIRAFLEKKGTKIGPNDLIIAAIALTHDLILVTHNTDEFGRVPGLRIEDWEAL
jgi:tRNA(fMet)-specific endonuclease VapC